MSQDSSRRLITRTDLCAVIVTYYPDGQCAEHLRTLALQIPKILIVDNGSSDESFHPVEAAAIRHGSVVMRLKCNLGIAAALNVGLNFARDHGFEWLLTFDQDSEITAGMVDAMLRVFEVFPRPDVVAIVASKPIDRSLDVNVSCPITEASGPGWRVIPCAGTSGNLVRVRSAIESGGFDESLFLDYVDFEFCLRLRKRGYHIVEATDAKLLHALGRMELRRLFKKTVWITNHLPLRYYYINRNRMFLWRLYWRSEARWVAEDIRTFWVHLFLTIIFENHVRHKLLMILRGLWDGLRNVRGIYRPLHARDSVR